MSSPRPLPSISPTRSGTKPPAALRALLVLLLAAAASELPALEISGTFRLGNMGLAYDRAETDLNFTGEEYQWGATLSVRQALSDDFTFASAFERDLVLRNTIYSTLTYRLSFLRLGVGPFFGLFNSTSSILKPGLSTSVQLEFPGIAYLLFRSDSSIGGRLVEVGDYTQERSDIAVGVYVRNVIMSGLLETRRFSQKTAAEVETIDSLTVYAFQTDIFRKNAPYKILLTFGYHQLTRSFIHPTETVDHTLNSIVLGTKVDMYLTPFLTTSLNLESSVYSFGTGELLGSVASGPGSYLYGYLFRAYVGVTFDTDELPSRQEP